MEVLILIAGLALVSLGWISGLYTAMYKSIIK